MAASERLPLTGFVPSAWLWGSFLAPGLVVPIVVFAVTFPEWQWAFVAGFYIGPYTTLPAVIFAVGWLREVLRCRQRAEVARMLGLSFEPRVSRRDIKPFLDFSLFRFTRKGRYSAANQMHGRFDDREFLVVDFGYMSSFPYRIHVKVPRKATQTVALLSAGSA